MAEIGADYPIIPWRVPPAMVAILPKTATRHPRNVVRSRPKHFSDAMASCRSLGAAMVGARAGPWLHDGDAPALGPKGPPVGAPRRRPFGTVPAAKAMAQPRPVRFQGLAARWAAGPIARQLARCPPPPVRAAVVPDGLSTPHAKSPRRSRCPKSASRWPVENPRHRLRRTWVPEAAPNMVRRPWGPNGRIQQVSARARRARECRFLRGNGRRSWNVTERDQPKALEAHFPESS